MSQETSVWRLGVPELSEVVIPATPKRLNIKKMPKKEKRKERNSNKQEIVGMRMHERSHE